MFFSGINSRHFPDLCGTRKCQCSGQHFLMIPIFIHIVPKSPPSYSEDLLLQDGWESQRKPLQTIFSCGTRVIKTYIVCYVQSWAWKNIQIKYFNNLVLVMISIFTFHCVLPKVSISFSFKILPQGRLDCGNMCMAHALQTHWLWQMLPAARARGTKPCNIDKGSSIIYHFHCSNLQLPLLIAWGGNLLRHGLN